MKRLALIAHDGKKDDVLEFARQRRELLSAFALLATRSTGTMIREALGLEVETVLSGPVGGDAQIAARVVVGEVDMVFFIVDPLDKHPHDPDIQTLLRACNVHNVPLATNLATAELLLILEARTSPCADSGRRSRSAPLRDEVPRYTCGTEGMILWNKGDDPGLRRESGAGVPRLPKSEIPNPNRDSTGLLDPPRPLALHLSKNR